MKTIKSLSSADCATWFEIRNLLIGLIMIHLLNTQVKDISDSEDSNFELFKVLQAPKAKTSKAESSKEKTSKTKSSKETSSKKVVERSFHLLQEHNFY